MPADVPLKIGNATRFCSDTAWKINTCTIEAEAMGALTVSYELIKAVIPTYTGTAVSPGTPVKTTFEMYRGSVTTATLAKSARRIRFRINNNLSVQPDLNAKASNKRYGTSVLVGAESVDAEVEYLEDPVHVTSGDELALSTIVLTAVSNASPAKTITVTGTNMKVPEWYFEAGGANEAGRYTVPYELDDNDLTGFLIGIG
jgi:hypothetical protein